MLGAALLALSLAGSADPPVVRVGSKKFTESVVLEALAARLAAEAGARVERRSELGGTRVLWEALRRGDLDLYPEYTGTIAAEILAGRSPPLQASDLAGLAAALAAQGVEMSAPLGFEDTYALGMRADVARRLGVRRISDLAGHPGLRLGLTSEFLDRRDGWPAVRAAYGLPPALASPRGLDHDVAYRALLEGELDVTDLYTTDPEILRHGLLVLEDDRRAFPEYQAVLLWRSDLAARAPAALAAVRRLEGRISVEAMTAMNQSAQLDRVPPDEVAAAFLRGGQAGDAGAAAGPGLPRRLAARTAEHLALVGLALALAIALAVPLGVLAARRPRTGRAILGLAGVLQTIPSLALLVALLPLLGIGARPAVAALVLYGLLPIVRNTHAGLLGVGDGLREAAAALGLSPWARLRRVELPLAAPTILAGVKTSAVIAVGTATLGALVGAGGYGQPILSGIRLASTPLILEGAVPAALLALLVERLFEALERLLVPRALRSSGGAASPARAR